MRALIDTRALLALSRRKDQHHAEAVAIARTHLAGGGLYVGSTFVLGEFHSHLLYLRGPEEAHRALLRLLDDPIHEWRAAPPELVREATVNWLFRFRDQAFSLVDAVSLEIMEREGLTHAFAFDRHFETAGFALLRAG